MYPSIVSLPPCLKVTFPCAMPGLSRTRVSGCVVCELAPWVCKTPKFATVAVAPMRKDLLPVRLLSHVSPMHTEFYLQLFKPKYDRVAAAGRATSPLCGAGQVALDAPATRVRRIVMR